jgi:PhoH-like ATPase
MINQFEKVFVLDTNIILDNAYNLVTLSEEGKNLIVLPETVLDEIDSKKSGFDEINFQARQFGRMLYDANIKGNKKVNELTIIETSVEKCTIYIISKEKYNVEDSKISLSILNDRKILEITKDFIDYNKSQNINEKTPEITFISLDVMARTRAISLGIPTEAMDLGATDNDFEFVKEIDLNDTGIELENGNNIELYNNLHTPDNFSYVFEKDGRKQLGVIKNNNIELIDEKELRKQNVNPMNTEQLLFSHSLLDNYYNIIVAEAKAGSGKTLLAISAAFELIKRKDFQRIVYIRNSVESLAKGEDVGYLSTNEAKFEIYNFPLFDTLAYIAGQMLKKSKENKPGKGEFVTEEKISEKVQDLVDRFQIETMWTGGMRGRTLSNAVVIVDEAQNMSNSTLQLVMSRIDSTCKIIVLGSNRQIDNQYITKHTNGLSTLLDATRKEHDEVNLFGIELHKVLRGPITQFAERVFSKD